jgi:DNA-binding PadR family transcriptional regulator
MARTRPALREPTYFILASLIDGPLHGYGIIKQAELLSDGRVRLAAGTLYGALDRLMADGLVEERGREVVEGRERRYYALTDAGHAVLAEEAQRLAASSRAVLLRLDAVRGMA